MRSKLIPLLLAAILHCGAWSSCPSQTHERVNITRTSGKYFNAPSHGSQGSRFPHDDPSDSLYLYWAAEYYDGVCFPCMRDTMKMYVEQHPFATHFLGEVMDAIPGTWYAASNVPGATIVDRIDHFNWLVKMQPVNQESEYQAIIIYTMAGCLWSIDLNEAANMFYNYSLMFPDSGSAADAWREIKIIRHYQSEIPQDTTPFHVLHFPLQPLPGGTSGVHTNGVNIVTFTIQPNPAKENTTAEISTSQSGLYSLQLYDVLGKKVKDVFSARIEAGKKEITLGLQDLGVGEYYLRLAYPGVVKTVKLVHER
ncbi:MAG: T9SS type A sorting domain-containing protein [Ignavibacteriota bacterium]